MSERYTKKEVLKIDSWCKLKLSETGHIIIGKNCQGKKINPTELHLIDRVNDDSGNQ